MTKVLKLKQPVKPVAGYMLLSNLAVRADSLGHTHTELGAALGVSAGYLAQLMHGLRDASMASNQFLLACARYLELPAAYVYVMADVLTLEDWVEFDADAMAFLQHVANDYMQKHGGRFVLEQPANTVFED